MGTYKVWMLKGGNWEGQNKYEKGGRSAVVKKIEKATGQKNGTIKVRSAS